MSVSFRWEVEKPERARSFGAGTSSDESTFLDLFSGRCSTEHIPMLKAMHLATKQSKSLWGEIADTLERLQGNDCEKSVTLRIWTEY